MNNYSLINGEFKNTISVLDRGLAYGDGFFETMLWEKSVREGKSIHGVEFWKEHLIRLRDGCKLLKISLPNDKLIFKQRQKILNKSSMTMTEGVLKMIITRGVGGRGYRFDSSTKPNIIFLTFPKTQRNLQQYEEGVSVKFCKNKISFNPSIYGFKHLNRLDSVVARSEWDDEFFEGIFLDSLNNVLEGTMSNVFFIKGKTLYTPKISGFGIKGIMREAILRKSDLFFDNIRVSRINKKMINEFDQMFLTNSVIKILPVKKLGRKKFKIMKNMKYLIEKFNPESLEDKRSFLGLL